MPNLTVTRIHLRNANPLGEGLFLGCVRYVL